MTKESYLQSLESLLKKHLSKSEIDDILRDYGEYFDDGRRQNKTDTEISAKLGDPEIIAQQFIEEIGQESNKERRTEKIDQALHSIKEGTEKAFISLKKGTSKTLHTASDKMASAKKASAEKQSDLQVGRSIKNGTKSVFSVVKSIVFLGIFAFLQCLFTIFVYGFCVSAVVFFISCSVFGIFCLGFSLSFFPFILSIAIILAVIAALSLAILFVLLIIFVLKENIKLIKNYILTKNNVRMTKEVA